MKPASLVVVAIALIAFGLSACSVNVRFGESEPLAGEMTPEWQEFAAKVDRACATNFNAGLDALDELEERAEEEDWEQSRAESQYRYIQADYQQRTHDEIAALGDPPARPDLLRPWLENVGRRADLMRDIGRGWETLDDHLSELRA